MSEHEHVRLAGRCISFNLIAAAPRSMHHQRDTHASVNVGNQVVCHGFVMMPFGGTMCTTRLVSEARGHGFACGDCIRRCRMPLPRIVDGRQIRACGGVCHAERLALLGSGTSKVSRSFGFSGIGKEVVALRAVMENNATRFASTNSPGTPCPVDMQTALQRFWGGNGTLIMPCVWRESNAHSPGR